MRSVIFQAINILSHATYLKCEPPSVKGPRAVMAGIYSTLKKPREGQMVEVHHVGIKYLMECNCNFYFFFTFL